MRYVESQTRCIFTSSNNGSTVTEEKKKKKATTKQKLHPNKTYVFFHMASNR